MPLNKYRLKCHLDDGITAYQCLRCKNGWSLGSGMENWKFCPYCGTQWEGRHECKPKDEKEYELYKRWEEKKPRNPSSVKYEWRLQHCYPGVDGKWEDCYHCGFSKIYEHPKWNEWSSEHRQAVCAVEELKSARKEEEDERATRSPDEQKEYWLDKIFRVVRYRITTDSNWREKREIVGIVGEPLDKIEKV